ncbi:MAG: phosphopantetheine-binding protein, partial [Syntrophomonadaceae bacterium]
TRSLQAYLKTKLPEYMLPSVIMKIESMPLNTSGKIDRKSLEEAGLNLSINKREYAAPKTPAEKEVARIASGLLNIEHVGIYDNFFELGGHSLLASQLVSRIRESMDIEVPLRLIFEKPVLSDLALEIEMLGNKKDGNKIETIKPVSRDSYRAIKSDFMKQ